MRYNIVAAVVIVCCAQAALGQATSRSTTGPSADPGWWLEKATEAAAQTTDANKRLRSYSLLCLQWATRKDRKRVDLAIEGIAAALPQSTDAWSRTNAERAMAVAHLRLGDVDVARQHCERARSGWLAMKDQRESWQFLSVASSMAETVPLVGLDEIVDTAQGAEPRFRIWPVVQLARALDAAGKRDDALAAIKKAEQMTREMDAAEDRSRGRLDLALAQAGLGMWAEAQSTAAATESPLTRAEIYIALGDDLDRSDPRIAQCLAKAVEAEGQCDGLDAVQAAWEIGQRQLSCGDKEGARQTCRRAFDALSRIENEKEDAVATALVAALQAATGELDTCRLNMKRSAVLAAGKGQATPRSTNCCRQVAMNSAIQELTRAGDIATALAYAEGVEDGGFALGAVARGCIARGDFATASRFARKTQIRTMGNELLVEIALARPTRENWIALVEAAEREPEANDRFFSYSMVASQLAMRRYHPAATRPYREWRP